MSSRCESRPRDGTPWRKAESLIGKPSNRNHQTIARTGARRAPFQRAAVGVECSAMPHSEEPIQPVTLSVEQRRALFLLKTAGRDGMTQGMLSPLGFDASIIAGLVEKGFATLTSSKARASGKMIAVRITQAGQDALVES